MNNYQVQIKPKITLIFPFYSTNEGSFSPRLHELMKYFDARNYHVTVLTSSFFKSDIPKGRFYIKTRIENIDIISFNTPIGNDKNKFIRVLNSIIYSLICSIHTLFKKSDILICSVGPITNGIPIILNGIFNVPQKRILEVRDLWPYAAFQFGLVKNSLLKKSLLLIEKNLYKYSHKIITLSSGQTEFLVAKHHNEASKFSSSSQIADLELFKQNSISHISKDFGKYLIYFGGMGPIHDVLYWPKIFSLFSEEERKSFQVLFFGSGPHEQKLKLLVEELKLDNLLIMGNIPKNELIPWIKNSIGTLFSTTNHDCQQRCSPNKIYDSFAAGKPVLQTSIGWIADLINIYDCGINLDRSNHQESKRLIQSYIDCDNKRKNQSNNAIRLASTEFEKNLVFNKYLDFLK
jgi:glycosyltransferase involved in cell wall biosynthesis